MSSSSSSLIPANPCFRNAAVNTVVVVPLLINNNSNQGENEDPTTTATTTTTRSAQSFDHLMEALRRYASKKHAESTTAELAAASSSSSSSDTKNTATPRPAQDSSSSLVLVVPNSNLTRPGDWKYPDTPLKSFHWQHGCQRLRIVVPNYNNKSQQQPTAVVDDEKNDKKDDSDAWIDLCPGRRTAAVVGVLNLHDCRSAADLHRACGELHTLATVRYATCGGGNNNKPAGDPPTPRDLPVVRLFLYDSFDQESQQFDLSSQMVPETSILAFPPVVLDDEEQMMMMDLHLNLVVSDLTVAIFRDLEDKIQESLCMVDSDYSLQQQQQQQQSSMQQQQQQGGLARRSLTRFVTGSGGSSGDGTGATQSEEPTKSARNLGISQLASLVNPESKLAKDSPTNTRGSTAAAGSNSSFAETFIQTTPIGSSKLPSKLPPLLTPLDVDADDSGGMSSSAAIKGPKDIDVMRKLDTGRREKYIADLCLLAGSPLDAYEHYLKAAELCKTVSMDPLWHASALEGCAAAHIAMAEAGGYSVDEYLENNFQLPEDIMVMAREDPAKKQASIISAGSKQTLPEVVFVLCDEALNILNRHKKVGHLYAELLLKLASYCSDEAESHLRCRWGEGPFCYSGELGDEPRWERTSVSKLKFNPLRNKDGESMIVINTHVRLKKLCALLTMATSVGSLDPQTRVDVATRCARICLDGIQPTQWKESKHERIRLPRKAAFFTAVAAEAASLSRSDETIEASKELWLLASKLYSLKPNPVDGGGSYGWATLRACCFDSLSTQGNCELSLEAVEQLLALLCKLDPDIPLSDNSNRMILLSKADERSNETTVGAADPEGNKYGPKDSNTKVSSGLEDVDVQDAIASASQFAKSIRASYASFTATSPFLTQQSKWAGEDPIPPACVPLSNFSPLSSLLVALKCVWPQMDYGLAFEAQMRCLNRLAKLRRAVPTSSTLDASAFAHGLKEKCLPVYVSAAMSVLELPRLELEIIQKRIKPDMSKQGAMATFFNPYDKKKQSDEPTARVAEGDERVMVVKFGNNLSVSIEITRGQLSFDDGNCERVKTSSVSFVLPPKACDFAAHFPFTVWPQSTFPAGRYEETSVLGVKGIDLTCFGRCFFLPVQTSKIENTKRLGNFPISASEYMYRTDVLSSPFLKPRIESYPSQPRLKICIDKSGCPADVVSISLADGEMYTAPSFRLSNSGGTNSLGKIECLEILSSSVSGRRMYCSNDADPPPEASESDFFRDLIHGSNPPPFKLRAKLAKLSVDGINDAREEATDHNTVTFQIATAHNFGLKLPNETSIEVVFRYRGPCTAKAEVWRKQTVVFRVLPKSGPRISSIEFRPDFIDDGAFADDIKNQWSMTYKLNSHGNACKQNTDKDYVTNVGLHPCLSVSGRDAVVMITIVNETSSCLTVTKTDQFAVSHAGSSMKAVMVDPLVSVKLKVAIPSLPRCDENGDVIDAASTLIDQLVFVWESQSESDLCQGKTRGYIRILPGCLRDIVANHPNILSQICQPPCSIQLTSCDKDASDATSVLALGSPLALDMYVAFESWVPKDVAEKCRIHLEFYCKRKVTFIGNELDRLPPSSLMTGMKLPEFVWAGKMSHSEDVVEHDRKIKHSARVAFLRPGTFAISACARISRRVNGATVGTQMTPSDIATQVEEIWWAPVAQTVNVSDTSLPAQ